MAADSFEPLDERSSASDAGGPAGLRCNQAKPTTPPYGAKGSYKCTVDYRGKPFSITWKGSPAYPELGGFPNLVDVDIAQIHQTPYMSAIWKTSTLLDYGAHALIRVAQHRSFPVLKLAHTDDESVKLIQHEVGILAELAPLAFTAKVLALTYLEDGRLDAFQWHLEDAIFILKRGDTQCCIRALMLEGILRKILCERGRGEENRRDGRGQQYINVAIEARRD